MDQKTLTPKIREALRRLVEFYKPERVHLFGSAARGNTGPQSGLDFLEKPHHELGTIVWIAE